MKLTLQTLLFIAFSVCVFFAKSQSDNCFFINSAVNLSSLEFENCSGALTYDVSGGGVNCEECENNQTFSNSGSVTITAFDTNNDECDEVIIQIVDDISIDITLGSVPACNEINYDFNYSGVVSGVSWDFNGDGVQDSNSASGSYVYSVNGNQTVSLTVETPDGCFMTVTETVLISGPDPELAFQGELLGTFFPLEVFPFNNFDCVVSYCVNDLTTDNSLLLNDISVASVGGVNSSYSITLNGVEVFSGNSVPADFGVDLAAQGSPGYNSLVYEITDSNGCVASKEYNIYWETFSINGAGISNETGSPIVNYCDDTDLTFEITASSTAGVTYYFFIGCQGSDFNTLQSGSLFSEVLNLDPGEVFSLDWTANTTSCDCSSDSFSAFLYTTNPCNTTPFQVGTESFQVSQDSDPGFTFDPLGCQNETGTMVWQGPAGLPFSGTCGGQTIWSVTEPDGTEIPNAGITSTLNYSYTQVGDYEVCLTVSTGVGCGTQIECNEICVQEQLSAANTSAFFPNVNALCVGETFEPTVTIPELECEPADILWYASPSSGVTIDDSSSETPIVTFTQKGDYTLTVELTSECGDVQYSSSFIAVGAPPIVTAENVTLSSCPDQSICFDEYFCVDECNSPFINSSVSVYEGTIANCNAPITNTLAWESSTNNTVNFPSDMIGVGCSGNDFSCDFSWLVPSNPLVSYTAVVSVENACGMDVQCIPISIIIPGSLTVPIADEVCYGYSIDPSATSLAGCTWLVNGSTQYTPGSSSVITITSDVNVTINCTNGSCPQSVSADITVLPQISPVVDGGTVICDGGTTILNANSASGVSYQWYQGSCADISGGTAVLMTGETNQTYEATLPGVYSVEVSNSIGCTECAQTTVVLENPPMAICPDLTFCENEVNELLGFSCLIMPAGATVVWTVEDSDSNVINANAPADYDVQGLLSDAGAIASNSTFTISFEMTSQIGCVYQGSYEVNIDVIGVSDVSEVTVCEGEELILAGGSSGSWTTGDLPVSSYSEAFGDLTINSTLAPGDYSGIYFGNGCTQVPYEIEVFEGPTASVSGLTILCNEPGSNIDLEVSGTGTGMLTYQWATGECASSSNISGETNEELNVTSQGTYSATVEDSNGCTACDEIIIQADEVVTSSCTDLAFCETETDESIGVGCVDVENPSNVNWDVTDSGNTVIASNISNTYSVEDVINAFGPISQNEVFSVGYDYTSDAGCNYTGEYEVTIQNLGIGDVMVIDTCQFTEFTLTGGAGDWETGELTLGDYSIVGGNLVIAQTLGLGEYANIAFDSGCSQQPYEIQVSELPSVSILGQGFICSSDNATQELTADASGIGDLSYQWSANDCSSSIALSGEENQTYSVVSFGIYSVSVTDEKGCVACAAIEIQLDPSPVLTCPDLTICENLDEEIIDLNCVTLPAGANQSEWNVGGSDNPNFPILGIANGFTVGELLAVFDPIDGQVQTDEDFQFYHEWTSDIGCAYTDSFQVTILDEAVSLEQIDLCSGDEINLSQVNSGDWEWQTIPNSSLNSEGNTDFNWLTENDDSGEVYELRYTSSSGCGAVDYEIQVNLTPQLSVSVLDENMCILSNQLISVDPDVATDITLSYENGMETNPLSTTDLNFSPTDLGITNTDPGELHFEGSTDYTTLINTMLTCSSEAFQTIDIVDTLASVAVPDFLCQGEEFEIDVCNDGFVDAFDFEIGGVSFTEADCPFEIPNLFGEQSYTLSAFYGDEYALQCETQATGLITIQQQLEYEFSTVSDPCGAIEALTFEITGGNTTGITIMPAESISSDELLEGDVFTFDLEFSPSNLSIDELFEYQIQITDNVCTIDVLDGELQYIAPPELGISIDELTSDFDGCIEDLLYMEISVPNTLFVDNSIWTFESSYIPFETLVDGEGLLIPDPIELDVPDTDSEEVIIIAQVFNACGSDVDSVIHIMNPSDIQLQVADFPDPLCPGQITDVGVIVNLQDYDVDLVVTPNADISWNPLDETIQIGQNVPAGIYDLEFTATGSCGDDVALAQIEISEFISAEFDVSGFTCFNQQLTFTPLNAQELSGFEWDFGDDFTTNNLSPVHSYIEPGAYEVTLTAFHSVANCSSSYSEIVNIGGTQVEISPGSLSYCGAGQAIYSQNLDNLSAVNWVIENPYTDEILEYNTSSTPILEFDYNPDAVGPVYYDIQVSIEDEFGCPSEDAAQVAINPIPNSSIGFSLSSASQEYTYAFSDDHLRVYLGTPCIEVDAEFYNTQASNNCVWENNFTAACDVGLGNCAPLTFCIDEETSGTLALTTDNSYQCESTTEILVEFLCSAEITTYVPNAFTPDGDGRNEFFRYIVTGEVTEFEFIVFNRWGDLIWKSEDVNGVWDGSHLDGDYYVPNGVYNWVMRVKGREEDSQEQRGTVTIVR